MPQGITDIETILIGSDNKLRSDTVFNKDTFNVKNSFRFPDKYSIKTPRISRVIAGVDEEGRTVNSRGIDVLYSIMRIDVFGHRWVVQTDQKTESALAVLFRIQKIIFGIASLIFLLIIFCAIITANKFSNLLRLMSNKLKEEVSNLTNNSKLLSESSSSLSDSTTQQAASLQETVVSVDQISAMVARNSDSAHQATEVSEKSAIAAQRGKEKAEELIDSIKQIKSGNDDMVRKMVRSNEEISDIVKVIQEISQKTKIINDIVFQTKLLSFNASVEAARAGEHGKGFAVVAEEVGNLAAMSGKAANEISEMIETSVKKVTSVVSGTKVLMDEIMKDIKFKVDIGTKNGNEFSLSLEEILSNVSVVNEMIREIATASNEQTTGIKEINKAMTELDIVTQANSRITQEVSGAASSLTDQAERINLITTGLSIFVDGSDKDLKKDHILPLQNSSTGSIVNSIKNKQSDNISEVGNILKLKPKYKTLANEGPKKVIGHASPVQDIPSSEDSRFEEI
jgi:methyl-accepting chemotaxis protein